MTKTWWVWCWLWVGALLAGCEAPLWMDSRAAFPGVPPDFALVFTVQPGESLATELPETLTRPAQHIVTPDRVLRVAFGSGVTPDLFPPPTATLSPREVERLWRIVVVNDLLQTPETVTHGADAARYHLAITADGARYTYTTTPRLSPGAVDLLRALVGLRGEAAAAEPAGVDRTGPGAAP